MLIEMVDHLICPSSLGQWPIKTTSVDFDVVVGIIDIVERTAFSNALRLILQKGSVHQVPKDNDFFSMKSWLSVCFWQQDTAIISACTLVNDRVD